MGGPNSGRRPNLERREKARELRSQGFTLEEIGARLGVTKEAVRQMLIACGVPRRLPKALRNRFRPPKTT